MHSNIKTIHILPGVLWVKTVPLIIANKNIHKIDNAFKLFLTT